MDSLKSARTFAHLLDAKYRIFGVKFGLESIIGLIPVIGDNIGLLLSCYLLWIGYRMRLPAGKLVRMVSNILIDAILGAIPILGDIADVIFKANIRNLAILEEYANKSNR